jgi:K+ transporter
MNQIRIVSNVFEHVDQHRGVVTVRLPRKASVCHSQAVAAHEFAVFGQALRAELCVQILAWLKNF